MVEVTLTEGLFVLEEATFGIQILNNLHINLFHLNLLIVYLETIQQQGMVERYIYMRLIRFLNPAFLIAIQLQQLQQLLVVPMVVQCM